MGFYACNKKTIYVIGVSYCLLYLYDIGQMNDFDVYYSHQKKRRLPVMSTIKNKTANMCMCMVRPGDCRIIRCCARRMR